MSQDVWDIPLCYLHFKFRLSLILRPDGLAIGSNLQIGGKKAYRKGRNYYVLKYTCMYIILVFNASTVTLSLQCILASIVIVTLKGMFLQFKELKRLWRLSKKDFVSIKYFKNLILRPLFGTKKPEF